MAFYDQAPNGRGRKPQRRQSERWEEEGTRYSDRKRTARDASAPDGKKPERRGPGRREDRPRQDTRDSRPHQDMRDSRSRRPEDSRTRAPRRPAREEEPRRPSYLDFEHDPTPRFEDPQGEPNENLLAGRNPIREALKSGRDIEKLLVMRGELSGSARQIVQMAREAHIPVQEVDKARLDALAPNHQGMIAFASAYAYATVDEILQVSKERGEAPFIIVLDGITDPHNLGAIIRSAECAGAHGVIVRERRGVGLTPVAVKASAGAVEHVKVARVTNLNRTLEELKLQGVWIYALSMEGEDYEKVDFTGGAALVVGSEGSGISRLTLDLCDKTVSLPVLGKVDSLNASVAAGIVMYRVLSSRRG